LLNFSSGKCERKWFPSCVWLSRHVELGIDLGKEINRKRNCWWNINPEQEGGYANSYMNIEKEFILQELIRKMLFVKIEMRKET
jgi:hypothetical protein